MSEEEDVSYRSLTANVDIYHEDITKGEKLHFSEINKKIEKCKEEIKNTMKTNIKSHKRHLERILKEYNGENKKSPEEVQSES
jgi:hypothetical protein